MHVFGAGIKCHLRAGHLQTKVQRAICRYKQSEIRKPPPDVQEIENWACMRRVLHKGRRCLLNSADTETALAALGSRNAGLFREEGQEAFCHQDLPICTSLISAPVFRVH